MSRTMYMKMDAKAVVSRFTGTGRIPRIIHNDDTATLRTAQPPHTLDSINCTLDYLKGTQVDCLCWCIGESIAYAWPSKVIENIFDLFDRGLKHAADWTSTRTDVMYSLHKQGIDYLPHLIDRARAQGLMFVASFRMNDTHIKSYPNSVLAPDFWKNNQQYRLWGVTDGRSYYNAAFDYSFPEVRKRYRDSILEVAENYDVDGIELDFTRTPYYFQPEEAWKKRGILTRFVREIRSSLDKIGKRRKKPFALVLRMPSRECVLKGGGIDAAQWIKEKLPTILIMSELVVNLNQRVEPWRTLCREAGVLYYPCVETWTAFNRVEFYSRYVQNPLAPRHDGWAAPTTDERSLLMQRAGAQNLLAQDPDGIATFNFPCRLAEGKNVLHTDPDKLKHVVDLLHQMGALRTLARKPRHYAYYQDLPIYVECNRPRQYHQTIEFDVRGKDVRSSVAVIRFRQIAEKNPHAEGDYTQNPIVKPGTLRYYLNDREIAEADFVKHRAPAGRVTSGFTLRKHEVLEVTIPGKLLRDGTNTLAFEMPGPLNERDPYVYIYDLEVDLTFEETPAGRTKGGK